MVLAVVGPQVARHQGEQADGGSRAHHVPSRQEQVGHLDAAVRLNAVKRQGPDPHRRRPENAGTPPPSRRRHHRDQHPPLGRGGADATEKHRDGPQRLGQGEHHEMAGRPDMTEMQQPEGGDTAEGHRPHRRRREGLLQHGHADTDAEGPRQHEVHHPTDGAGPAGELGALGIERRHRVGAGHHLGSHATLIGSDRRGITKTPEEDLHRPVFWRQGSEAPHFGSH